MATVCPRRGRLRSQVFLTVVSLCLAAPSLGAQASGNRRLVVTSGVVRDRLTGRGVPDATVALSHAGTGTLVAVAHSDSLGAFAVQPLPAGRYAIRVGRAGYVELADTVVLEEGSPEAVTAFLTPESMALDSMVVSVDPSTPPKMVEFEQRRARGIGTFITRADVEKRHPVQVSDLFRNVPGIRVVPVRGTNDAVLTMRGGCRPGLVIDGTPVFGGLSLDMTMTPHDVEGIEIYGSAETPIEYSKSQCGTIMVWTRAPQHVSGRGHPWKLLGVVGGVILTLILIH